MAPERSTFDLNMDVASDDDKITHLMTLILMMLCLSSIRERK